MSFLCAPRSYSLYRASHKEYEKRRLYSSKSFIFVKKFTSLEKKSTITRFDFTVKLGNSERLDRQLLLDSEFFSNDQNLLLNSEQSGNSEQF